jgi:hypothetical protein
MPAGLAVGEEEPGVVVGAEVAGSKEHIVVATAAEAIVDASCIHGREAVERREPRWRK